MARMLQHLLLAMLSTSTFAWRLNSTHQGVIPYVTDDVTLRCDNVMEVTTEEEGTMYQITKIRLLKSQRNSRDSSTSWRSIAEINVPDISHVALVGDINLSDVIASGHIGAPSQSFLSVTWPTASLKTVGSYRCEVDGFIEKKVDFMRIESKEMTITNFDPSTTNLMDTVMQIKAKSNKLTEKLENMRKAHEANIITLQKDMEVKCEKRALGIMNEVKRLSKKLENLKTAHDTLKQDMEVKKENQTLYIMEVVKCMVKPTSFFWPIGEHALLGTNVAKCMIQPTSFFWPTGEHSLLATSDGCPDATPGNQFLPGFIKIQAKTDKNLKHATSAGSHVSQPFYERRDSSKILNFRYCTHERSGNQETLNIPWPKGSYCILRDRNGGCPENFQIGAMAFYLESKPNIVVTGKNRPFSYHNPPGSVIAFHFCCRRDGNPNTAVILPTSKPFYFYRYRGVCQKVLNMNVTEEWIFVDTNDRRRDHFGQATHPDSSLNDVRLQLCYYEKSLP